MQLLKDALLNVESPFMFPNELITHSNPSYEVTKYYSIAFSTAAHIRKYTSYVSFY